MAEAVIIEVRQRSCVKFGKEPCKASVTEVKCNLQAESELVVRYCVEFTTSRGINNLVAVPTTLRIDFDYKLPTTKNIRTRNIPVGHICHFFLQTNFLLLLCLFWAMMIIP